MKEKILKNFNEGELNYVNGILSFDEIFKEHVFANSKFGFGVTVSASWLVFYLEYKKFNIVFELKRSSIKIIDLIPNQEIYVRDFTLDKRFKNAYLNAVGLGILIRNVDEAFHDGGYEGAFKGMNAKKVKGVIYKIEYIDEHNVDRVIHLSADDEIAWEVNKALDKHFNYNLRRYDGKGCSIILLLILTFSTLLSFII